MATTRAVTATEFKAKCLSILKEIEETGGSITVTRRGHPVAVLKPAVAVQGKKSFIGSWVGKGRIVGDIVNTDNAGLWDLSSSE